MALRPYDARRGGNVGAVTRRGGGGGGQDMMMAMPPFGGAMQPFGGSIFGGQDPFKEFSAMPFGGPGGSMMSRFDQLSDEMMKGFGDAPGPGGPGGSARGMAAMPGNGSFACQSFAFSSVTGPDGKVHTERFASSDVGNRAHGIREAQHAYSNSSTGMDKMGLERHLGDRARKVVKERDRNTMEERSSEMLRGMDESGRDTFDRDFGGKARHLPPHGKFDPAALRQVPAGVPSLPGSSRGNSLQLTGGNSMPGSRLPSSRRR
mmetsp:Transcript_1089/g.2210  ORF Transcript_1089/g.2210 Transcript_1089/m.2210 type:complete len:262 (-) Transcript_1089:84-869(-)